MSALVEAALRGEPQRIIRRGKDAVMVLSEKTYVAFKCSAKSHAPNFVAHLFAVPHAPHVRPANVKPAESRARLALLDIPQ